MSEEKWINVEDELPKLNDYVWKSAVWNGRITTSQKSKTYFLIRSNDGYSDDRPTLVDIGCFVMRKHYDDKEPSKCWFSHASGYVDFGQVLFWKEIGVLPCIKKKPIVEEVVCISKEDICDCDGRDMPIYEEDNKNWCPQCGLEVY